MVAMAAIVAQNGATGQSLVEQFTTGNLNPFIGGYAKQDDLNNLGGDQLVDGGHMWSSTGEN